MYLYLIAFAIIAIVAFVTTKYQRKKQAYKHIPGVEQFLVPPLALKLCKYLPFLSSFFPNQQEGLFDNDILHEKFGPVVKFVYMGVNIVSINDIDFRKQIATRGAKEYSKEGLPLFVFMDEMFGPNVLSVSDNQTWQRHRLLLNPAFTDHALGCVNDATVDSVKEFIKQVEKNPRRDMLKDASNITLDVICKAGFGCRQNPFDATQGEKTLATETMYILRNFPVYMALPRFLQLSNIGFIGKLKESVQFFKSSIADIIAERRSELKTKDTPTDMLSMLLNGAKSEENQDHAPLNDIELYSNCFIMIVAGHDTTASTITYTLYYLANHPEVLKKAQGIVDQVLTNNRDPEYSDFDDLYYINWIIKEAMRLTPVVKGIPRTLEKTIEWEGYEIPKGTLVFTPFNTHKDPEFFPDPLAFKPERWDGLELSNRYAYTPFGFGNRACIGKKFAMIEAVIALSMIIQRYNVSIDKDYGPLNITTVVTSKPKKDLYVTFTKR